MTYIKIITQRINQEPGSDTTCYNSNQDEYPNFIYTGIVNKVNTLISYILEYLTGWIP